MFLSANRFARQAVSAALTALAGALLTAASGAIPATAGELQVQAAPIGFPNPSLSPATLVEFSYSVQASGLTFLPDTLDGDFVAGVFASVTLFDSQNLPVDSVAQAFATRTATASDSTLLIGNRLRMVVQPGKYTAELKVTDVASKVSATNFFHISLDSVDTQSLLISGIELAHSLTHVGPDTTGNSLIKNGWKVFPNPVGAVPTTDSLLKVYAEVYNLKPDEQGKYHMGVRIELRERDAKTPQILDEVYWQVQSSSIVFARSLAHGVKTTGQRLLSVIVTDPAAGVTDTSSRKIYFQNPNSLAQDSMIVASPYDTTSLESRSQMIYWLLTPREREFFNSLSDDGKQEYISQFWIDNGDNPSLGVHTFRDDVLKRYNFAMENYSFTSEARDGWKRDPGRVLMQYGFPDEIIDVPLPTIENDITEESAWERWNYDRVQGGVYFIFANQYGYSEYRLRHSNAQGETYDPGIERNINQLFRQSGG